MIDKFILDDKDNPVPEPNLEKWASWYQVNKERCQVKKTVVGEFTVSTVFLSLDHSFGRGEPLLYETVVLPDNIYPDEDGFCERYRTKDEALRRHIEVVGEIKNITSK